MGPPPKFLAATLRGVSSQVVTSFGVAQAANASPKPPPSILDSPTRSPHDSSRTLNHPLQVSYAYGDHPPSYNPPDMPTASSALMPMLTSTNSDSRHQIDINTLLAATSYYHHSIRHHLIALFRSLPCPYLVLLGGDMATRSCVGPTWCA